METTNKRTEHITAVIFALLVSLPLLFRGLYFETDLSVFGIIASVIIILITLKNKEKISISVGADIPLCALTLIYAISVCASVNTGQAVLELLKYVLLLAVYFAVKGVFNSEKSIKVLLCAFAGVIALSSLISLLTAAGVVNYPGAYSASEIERWLNGTVQYHNAFGILAVAAFFISAGIFAGKGVKNAAFYVNSLLSYLLMFGVIMSYSRGAWVAVPLVFVIYMIFADKDARISLFVSGISSLASVMLVFGWFSAYVLDKNAGMCVLYLIIGLVLSALFGAVVNVIITAWSRTKFFAVSASAVCVVIIAAVLAVVLVPQLTALLPQQLADRISGISFTSETVTERFVFYGDAWRIAQRNLITGSGGGAWADLYGIYQSYDYASSQAHSYIMQLLVESGFLGLISFIAAIVMFIISAVRVPKRKKVSRGVLCAIVSAAASLVIHSFIDFDLSIFAISVMLWCMFAALSALDTDLKAFAVNKAALYAVCGVLLVVWTMSCVSVNAYNGGLNLFKEEKYEQAYEKFGTASAFNPTNSVYRSYKSLACMKFSKNADLRRVSVESFEKAAKMAPYNMPTVQNGIALFSATGAYEIAMDYSHKSVELQPKNLNNYLAYIQSARDVVRYYMGKGAYEKVLNIVTVAKDVDNLAEENGVELTEAAKQVLSYFNVVYYNLSGNPVD